MARAASDTSNSGQSHSGDSHNNLDTSQGPSRGNSSGHIDMVADINLTVQLDCIEEQGILEISGSDYLSSMIKDDSSSALKDEEASPHPVEIQQTSLLNNSHLLTERVRDEEPQDLEITTERTKREFGAAFGTGHDDSADPYTCKVSRGNKLPLVGYYSFTIAKLT